MAKIIGFILLSTGLLSSHCFPILDIAGNVSEKTDLEEKINVGAGFEPEPQEYKL